MRESTLMQIMELDKTDQSLYDYTNQAWTFNGLYVRCGHPESMNCKCFGKLHENEPIKENAEMH